MTGLERGHRYSNSQCCDPLASFFIQEIFIELLDDVAYKLCCLNKAVLDLTSLLSLELKRAKI